jgi:hypothetical protein
MGSNKSNIDTDVILEAHGGKRTFKKDLAKKSQKVVDVTNARPILEAQSSAAELSFQKVAYDVDQGRQLRAGCKSMRLGSITSRFRVLDCA